MFRSSNSVTPTGTDHRGGDDLRSGEPALSEVEGDLVFNVFIGWGGDRVGVDGTKTRTSGGKTLSSRRTAPTQAKAGLEWATGPLRPRVQRPALRPLPSHQWAKGIFAEDNGAVFQEEAQRRNCSSANIRDFRASDVWP